MCNLKETWDTLTNNYYQQSAKYKFLKECERKQYIPTQDQNIQICSVIRNPENCNCVAALLYRPYFINFFGDSKRHLESTEITRAAQHVGIAAYNKFFNDPLCNRKFLALETSIRVKKQVNRTRCGLMLMTLLKKRNFPGSTNSALLLKSSFIFYKHTGEECSNGVIKSVSFCS